MTILTFQVILVIFLRTGCSVIIQRSAFFNTKENLKVDVGNMIKRQTTRSLVSCTQECLSEPLCASFNYDGTARQGVCELYKDGGEMKLTHEPGWLCGQLLERKKIVKPPAQCKTWRTKDGGCCVFPFLYQGRLHDSCVFDGQLWCSITENYDIDKMSGTCQDFNFTFTTLGARNATGPADTSGYQGTTLQDKVKLNKGIQIWQVPLNGSYVIEAWGASGAQGRESSLVTTSGGKGAYIKGTFNLTRGTILKILVGQAGSIGQLGVPPLPGGGGGGTFITYSSNAALIVAGGGGGGGAKPGNNYEGDPGQITEGGSQSGGSNGAGGKILVNGSPSSSFEGAAGGGLIGDGESAILAGGGRSFENGGKGGDSKNGAVGGFGGGGGGVQFPGAGGGYSGGGVREMSKKTIAGGGGSFNSGVNPAKEAGVKEGDGKVVITIVDLELQ